MSVVSINTTPDEELKQYLIEVAQKLHWGDVNDIIMDVGCGLGHYSTLTLLEVFPNIKKLVAIDQASDLIKTAALQTLSEKIEFYAADVKDIFTLATWEGQMTKIVSIDCFNWVTNPTNGFLGIKYMLRPRGTAVILFNINSPYEDCLKEVIEKSNCKYEELAKDSQFPRFPAKRMDFLEYKEMVEEAGLRVIECEVFYRHYVFSSNQEFLQRGMEYIDPFLISVPKEEQGDFKKQFFETFTLLNGMTQDGNPCMKIKSISILIQKP